MNEEFVGDNQMTVVDEHGEIIESASTGITLDQIVRQQTGGVSNEVKTSCDLATTEGQNRMELHLQYQGGKNEKAARINEPFDLIAYTSKPVAIRNGEGGVKYDPPKLGIRTVLECADGTMFSSSSAWVYQSLAQIIATVGQPSQERPIKMVMKKAGNADKLFRVIQQPTNGTPTVPPKHKK
jgi:hypothetical protein